MTIQNQLKLIPLSEIKYTREARQRTDLSSASVVDLAYAIVHQGLLQNIGIKLENNEIVFGERRLTAFKLLNKSASEPIKYLLDIGIPLDQANHLKDLTAKHNQYDSWSKIPCRLIKGADKLQHAAIEFIENVSRTDLPWQDKAQAAYRIHKEALAATTQRNANRPEDQPAELWANKQTADLLGISEPHLSRLIGALRELESASEKTKSKIKAAIKDSRTSQAAVNAAKAIKERHGEHSASGNPINRLAGGLLNKSKSQTSPPPESESSPKESCPIILDNFHEWAADYSGEPFNFIHCDFPYGLDFNQSQGMATSAATKQIGQYNDSEQTYWDLLETLQLYKKKLIAPSAHMMFWFSKAIPKNKSYRLEDKTKAYFANNFSEAIIQSFDMIWHCSDNLGTIPDARRYGRRTYETAMLLTFGDRPIVRPKALSFASPRGDRIHRSQKPIAVLTHFLSMFVDSSSTVLDPTTGSGTSILVAKKLGAKHLVGIEMDEEMHTTAVELYKKGI